MMIISKLLNGSGSARKLLGVREEGILDVSGDNWNATSGVLSGIVFKRISLRDTGVRPTFVECQFDDSVFISLRTNGQFWGAMNLWMRCSFENLKLDKVISPQNRFVDCAFTNCTFRKYQPCETAFVSCVFHQLKIDGFHAKPNMRNVRLRKKLTEKWPFPELESMDNQGLSVLFKKCHFETPEFINCRFENVAFTASTFITPRISDCDLSGVVSDLQWWSDTRTHEPDAAYKEALIDEITRRLGKDSWTFGKVKECLAKYQGKEFRIKWSRYVIDGGIPDEEYDILEQIIDSLRGRFV